MISYDRDPQQTISESSVKIIGLGGAGGNMLDRVALDGLEGAEMLCVNTDIRQLKGSLASEKVQIGKNLTMGLGAGGDPEVGLKAVQEAEQEILAALKGRSMVFLCVGLGGGTGSGAAPLICRLAREAGAFVVVFATMPFTFEGGRRRDQAETSLNELSVLANALVTFENNRMGELVVAKQGIHEAFAAADEMIAESVKAVTRLVLKPGLINVGLDDLMTALRTPRSRCLFGSGIGKGENRTQQVLENTLSSPLLDQGSLLAGASTVLVHICGGENLTLYEVELLMQGLSKHVPKTAHILFGAAVDAAMGDSLSVTLVSALPEDKWDSNQEDTEPEPQAKSDPEPEPDPDPEPEPEPELEILEAPEDLKDLENLEGVENLEKVSSEVESEELEPELLSMEKIEDESEDDDCDSEADDEMDDAELEISSEDATDLFEEGEKDDEGAEESEELEELKGLEDLMNEEVDDEEAEDKNEDEGEDESESEDESVSPYAPPVKTSPAKRSQAELELDGAPKGRFEEQPPNIVDGEDLDIPAFLRNS